MAEIYDFTAKSLAGEDVPLQQYAGKVLLIVNTASKCGFTPQYEGLEALYRELAPRGFAVLGFPCNQFGAQEPGDANEIAAFCESNYDVTFPMFEKIEVNGCHAHPLLRLSEDARSRACSARRSNGISPSSWSTVTARWWRGTRRPRRRKH